MTRDESIVAQMDLISREVAHSTPLVSESEPLGNLKNEYLQDNRFLAKIDVRLFIYYIRILELIFFCVTTK